MTQGTVKWFDADRGFGFITPEGDMPDIFVHYTAIPGRGLRYLEKGDRVRFEIDRSDSRGPRAKEVEVISTAAA